MNQELSSNSKSDKSTIFIQYLLQTDLYTQTCFSWAASLLQ
jgi:hypothetical protein